jgi:Flp pilus assembly protein CpaB
VENIMSSKLFTTRQGTVLLGVIAAVVAGIALIVYLHNYRNSVNGKNVALQVLVAKQLIQKGTSGDIVGSTSLYETTSIPKSQLKAGAITDPSSLAGTVATTDIYPNQQLTASDFTPAAADSATQQLARSQRAVVLPLDTAQAVGGQLVPGDHVDVWVAFNGVNRLLYQNVYILGIDGGNVTFRANAVQAGELIYASQNGSIWLALRPTVGSIVHGGPPVGQNSITK